MSTTLHDTSLYDLWQGHCFLQCIITLMYITNDPLSLPRLLPDLTVYLSVGVFSEAGTAYPSRVHEFTPVFCGFRVAYLFIFLSCPIMSLYAMSSML